MAKHAHAYTDTPVLVFHEVEFEVVDNHGQNWLMGPQIGAALGYEKGRVSIHKLYDSNADEFDETMTQVVKLDYLRPRSGDAGQALDHQNEGSGQVREVRIFSPRGCYLLAMLARTERAKEFRRWVLDVLEGHAAPKVGVTMTNPQHLAALKYRDTLIEKLARVTHLGTALDLHANYKRISLILGIQPRDLESLAPALKQQRIEGV